MSAAFRVIELPQRLDQVQEEEVMGSKPKFWLLNPRSGRRCLWKEARAGSGEDWSEKVAQRIAGLVGVPCPRIDLARLGDKHGVLSWDFLWEWTSTGTVTRGSLIHGNDLLWHQDSSYPRAGAYRVKQHTVAAVHNVLCNHRRAKLDLVTSPQGNAFDSFIGYLLLDALIGNTDRHHENWGIESVRTTSETVLRLAPSYDHASSLGRELSDDKRDGRMSNRGRGTVADYADKAKSAFGMKTAPAF